ncbi:hypothetical protein [Flavobacterium sp. W22_SRS_FP1]|uniref:hypothetical protein n=1 Tax=Flavobacterium sp. W22_SRS_FP1 TaxID=3240276 RepID=UPI003F93BBD0
MAKICFKITEQEIDYYFLWNTYWEKPGTITMDLASFMVYLNEGVSSLSGIIASWKNLKLNSTSLDDITEGPFFNDIVKNYLCFQTQDEYIKSTAIKNVELSKVVSEKLDFLSAEYQNAILVSTETETTVLLDNLDKDFQVFIADEIANKIPMLPIFFYNNIDDLYDKLNNQIASEKKDDFMKFIYKIDVPQKIGVEWYSKLLYSKNIEWHNIPMTVRANSLITDDTVTITEEIKSPFLRNIHNVTITNYSPTRSDLLGYYNHLMGENYNFAIELKDYLEELGFIDEKNSLLTLANLNYLIDNEILKPEDSLHRLPDELVNFIHADGKLLPPIYDYVFERHGLYIFSKYQIQLKDVYTKNGDLVFSNLDDIDVFLVDNEIAVTYEDDSGYRFFKKVIVLDGKPVQILTIPPFEYPPVNF